MAVYTQVDDHTLSAFLDMYDVGTATSFKGIAEGVENSNYLLETTGGQFILTLYEKRANPADLPYFLDMMEHLAADGMPAPLPIRDKTGASLQTLSGRPACLISFLRGVSVNHMTDAHCAALGETLAEMHNSLQSYTQTRPNDLSLKGWQKLASDTQNGADSVEAGLKTIIFNELEYLASNWPSNLPSGNIHADLFPDNVLFTGTKITGLIDFYFGCTDMLAYDIAVCINAWCFDADHTFQATRAKRLTEMYDSVRRLSAAEIDALPILCRGAALRFLLTRLYDWLNPVKGAVVRPKDPLDYLKRLQFHQSVKDTASYVV
ncbi:homoserine kinase [Kordiimonas pumila]|uniref:Homoserine kinase n=1 Tax=Kordiimonas pumila TaxID=2161677 RepID=A0ABV7D8X1_9PROT|nr:homoserine kinase [Kordiimonas pumila]